MIGQEIQKLFLKFFVIEDKFRNFTKCLTTNKNKKNE